MNYFPEHMLPEERFSLPVLPTFPDFVGFLTRTYGNLPSLSDGTGEAIPYACLGDHIAHRRHVLERLQVRPGERIGICCENTVACVEWFLAVVTYGAVAVMLPSSLPDAQMPALVSHFELSLLLSSRVFSLPVPCVPLEAMDAESTGARTCEPEDIAAIFFTGGSTGRPKGVMLSHRALLRGSLNGAYRDGTIYGQTFVAVLPLSHVFGMVFSLLSGLYTGSRIALCPDMRDVLRVMQGVHPTTMIAVPGLCEILLKMAQMHGPEILGGKLRLIICGAAPVPARLHHAFQAYGIAVDAGYGLTETANLVSGNLDMDKCPESVGQLYPCQEARIVEGELQVRGDMLFSGYWKDEAATEAAFQDGWFRTGDLARFDEEGFLYITGRIKNLIILPNGENISPEEVENAFCRSLLVRDCLLREETEGDTSFLSLEVLGTDGVADEHLREACWEIAGTLPTWMRPAKLYVRHSDFARSGAMKILRDQEREGEAHA